MDLRGTVGIDDEKGMLIYRKPDTSHLINQDVREPIGIWPELPEKIWANISVGLGER